MLVDLITVIEATLPVPLLPGPRGQEPTVTFNSDANEQLKKLAERVYDGFLHEGLTRQAAKDRLLKTEPFNHFPGLIEEVVGSAQ